MDWTDEQEALIDRYLNQTMTGEDQKEWDVLMKIPTFRWHVEARKKEFENVNDDDRDTKVRLSFKKPARPSSKTRIWVLIIILILMMLVIFSI